eukprot:m.581667 g.581667  ORF g.581667 m.581667 type:complete len:101 (-) comp22328_c0_seq1:554-856(-)
MAPTIAVVAGTAGDNMVLVVTRTMRHGTPREVAGVVAVVGVVRLVAVMVPPSTEGVAVVVAVATVEEQVVMEHVGVGVLLVTEEKGGDAVVGPDEATAEI